METFICNIKNRKKRILHKGQKVRCTYYHESTQYPMRIIGGFTPVKLGVIVGDAGIRPYYLAVGDGSFNGTEQYLYVKFKEYFFKKAIPISCIKDAKEAVKNLESFLKENEHKIGEKGYSMESYDILYKQMNEAKEFIYWYNKNNYKK